MPLTVTKNQVQLTTDASGTGWGSWTGTLEASGTWNKNVSFQPSNFRELLVIYKSILSFRDILANKRVQVLTDNVTSAAYVNRFGGSSKKMCDLMTSIFIITQELSIELSAKFLAGVKNGKADGLSRVMSPYEWQLHPVIFNN